MRRLAAGLCALIFLAGAPLASALAEGRGETERRFAAWLSRDLWPEARAAGISRATFDRALGRVNVQWDLPDIAVPGSDGGKPQVQRQAEFGAPAAYFAERNLRAVVEGGSQRARRHARLLAEIERRYGVPGHILIAIWGRESGFGAAKIPHDAFAVLATKSFLSPRRDMFRAELIAALTMVESGRARPEDMKSSWAGALGQPQFLPSSFLAHAVDFDRDGQADIWNSVPDTLASIANYLKHHGWDPARDWGFEVVVPERVSCALEGPDRGRTIRQWAETGITRVSGRPFPAAELDREGYLLMPAGRHGPAFIVTPNFYVLKKYNESDLYALFVGHGGDRIAYGSRPFVTPWQDVGRMYRSDIAAMQRVLEGKGMDVGGADGLPGFRTRRSIGEWQAARGERPTCFPTPALFGVIR